MKACRAMYMMPAMTAHVQDTLLMIGWLHCMTFSHVFFVTCSFLIKCTVHKTGNSSTMASFRGLLCKVYESHLLISLLMSWAACGMFLSLLSCLLARPFCPSRKHRTHLICMMQVPCLQRLRQDSWHFICCALLTLTSHQSSLRTLMCYISHMGKCSLDFRCPIKQVMNFHYKI